jgi:glycosyltransferase involved in cell wall biosynthesis
LISLSVIILTYNEELNIEKCLDEIHKLTTNIVIVDSYSSDRTVEICKNYDCKIYEHVFVNQAEQLNWALENIEFNTEWVLRLDADEYFTPDLLLEMKNKLDYLGDDVTGVFFKRRVYFMGKWIKHGGYYPTKILRMWRNGQAVCEQRWMDEHMVLLNGSSLTFEFDFVDDNKKNIGWWIAKHNDYATREAIEQLNYKYKYSNNNVMHSNIFGTHEQRKKFFKEKIYYALPLGVKPFIYFVFRYFLRLGFLDGFRGGMFHILQGFWYRLLVDLKVYEIEKKHKSSRDSIPSIIKKEYNIHV